VLEIQVLPEHKAQQDLLVPLEQPAQLEQPEQPVLMAELLATHPSPWINSPIRSTLARLGA
jgi:hypothetical protein